MLQEVLEVEEALVLQEVEEDHQVASEVASETEEAEEAEASALLEEEEVQVAVEVAVEEA